MRTALILLFLFGIAWLAALNFYENGLPHFLLDAILPSRILEETTLEEKRHILDSLGKTVTKTSYLPWIGAWFICIISGLGLWRGQRIKD